MTGAAQLEPADFFVLRTPLLPHDALEAWSSGLGAADDEAAFDDDRRRLRERLRAIIDRADVREALFIASPALQESLRFWIEAPSSARGQKVERTLVRYFARMTSRPTPFGLFAGCSLGRVAAHTALRLDALETYRRSPRLDGDYLSGLSEQLTRDPVVRRALTYRPNSSLTRLAGRVQFAEARFEAERRYYFLNAADLDAALEVVLHRCAEGASIAELSAALVSALAADGVTTDEADQFVGELIDSQLIVSDLEPPLTGAEPLGVIAEMLASTPATAPLALPLERARKALASLAAGRIGATAAQAQYDAIAEALSTLPAKVDRARLFQVDLVKPAREVVLGPEPIAEIARATILLQRLAGPRKPDGLTRFRDAFVARYEQREVPLAEALDEEIGIGFERSSAPAAEASPLLQGLALGGKREQERTTGWNFPRLLRRLEGALRSGAQEIDLADSDLDDNAADDNAADDNAADADRRPTLPNSFAAMATLAAPSEESIAQGEFRILLRSVFGPSGANLLGRFCHADPALADAVREYLKREEAARPDALFAEVVHLPGGRAANVLSRPVLRGWEIVFLGVSGAPRERQISVDDLLVCVRDGRVLLRSRRLDREVIPRLTTAHQFGTGHNLGVYRFLCALQAQDGRSLRFDWGALDAASFLPRVRTGRVVLALARWRVDGAALATLAHDDPRERFVATQQLRRRLGLPRWVAVADSDNVLPVDLDNTLMVDAFVQLVQNRSQVLLIERFGADGLCAHGPEGRFVNELVVPFVNRGAIEAASERARTAAATVRRPTPLLTRRFPPGSEWLFVKLYTGAAVADEVLRRVVAPVVSQALQSAAADSWFFIRYRDPDSHVRLRLHGDPERLQREVLPALNALIGPLDDAGVRSVQLDTYEREVERYGGDEGMLLSEQLFAADSEAVLAIVQRLDGDSGADARWRLALRGMDQLLDDLGFSLDDKQTVVRRCRDGFAREHGVDATVERQLGERFRKERLALENLLDRSGDESGPFADHLEALRVRSERLVPVAASLRTAIAGGRVHAGSAELAASFLHMHANRIVRAAARAHELVLYDYLARLYEGQRARRKRSP